MNRLGSTRRAAVGAAAAVGTGTAVALARHATSSPAHRLQTTLVPLRTPGWRAQPSASTRLACAAGLTGRWKKDKNASQDMTAAMDAVELATPLRWAVGILSTLDVTDDGTSFGTTIKAGGVLDVRERYPWDPAAPTVVHPRRDKRRGSHTGRVLRSEGGHPVIRVEWGPPHGGVCDDEFILSEDGRALIQRTTMVVDGVPVPPYDTVYRRA